MMEPIKIDDNVPLPKARSKYPLGKMEVGQSFFLAGRTQASLSGIFAYHHPKKFTARKVTENGVDGVRVWRVA